MQLLSHELLFQFLAGNSAKTHGRTAQVRVFCGLFAWYLQQFGTRTRDFAWHFLYFVMFTFHFAWYLLHFGMFTFRFVPYLLHVCWHVHLPFCIVFATCWYFKRSSYMVFATCWYFTLPFCMLLLHGCQGSGCCDCGCCGRVGCARVYQKKTRVFCLLEGGNMFAACWHLNVSCC